MLPTTELQHIIQRLKIMQWDERQSTQTRHFQLYGVELVTVTYDQATQVFTLTEHRGEQSFQFDDIDLAAIEIYELLHQLKLTF